MLYSSVAEAIANENVSTSIVSGVDGERMKYMCESLNRWIQNRKKKKNTTNWQKEGRPENQKTKKKQQQKTNMRNSMWTRQCLYPCVIIVLLINLQQISANDNTHYLPPLECNDPYGRPQVSRIFDHRNYIVSSPFFSFILFWLYFSSDCNRSLLIAKLNAKSNRFSKYFCDSVFFPCSRLRVNWEKKKKGEKMSHWNLVVLIHIELHVVQWALNKVYRKSIKQNDKRYTVYWSLNSYMIVCPKPSSKINNNNNNN